MKYYLAHRSYFEIQQPKEKREPIIVLFKGTNYCDLHYFLWFMWQNWYTKSPLAPASLQSKLNDFPGRNT